MPDPDPLLQLVMNATVPHAALRALCDLVLTMTGEPVDVMLILQGQVSADQKHRLEQKLREFQAQPGVQMLTPLLRELPLRPEEKPPA